MHKYLAVYMVTGVKVPMSGTTEMGVCRNVLAMTRRSNCFFSKDQMWYSCLKNNLNNILFTIDFKSIKISFYAAILIKLLCIPCRVNS